MSDVLAAESAESVDAARLIRITAFDRCRITIYGHAEITAYDECEVTVIATPDQNPSEPPALPSSLDSAV